VSPQGRSQIKEAIMVPLVRLLAVLLVVFVIGAATVTDAQAASCRQSSLRGTYAYVASSTTFGAVGLMKFNGAGDIAGHDMAISGGTATPRSYTGTYSVNPDCTVSAEVSFTGGGTATAVGVVNPRRGEVRFIDTTLDPVVTFLGVKQ
jgi:hypothetical protein